LFSFTKDDSINTKETQKVQYVNKTTNISQNGTSELRFNYDSDNRLTSNETDSYIKTYTYSNNRIVKIESTP